MRRAGRILVVLVIVLAALLTVNYFVLNDQTRQAEQTKADGELIELEGGIGLQYVDQPAAGSGPEGQPIVLLHCYTCSGQWWEPLTPLLNEGHRVITIDLIGHGGSEKPSSGYEISAQSAAVAALLNELGVSGATVVGHSMGGLVATSLAEQSSELVDRLVLIGTPSEAGQAKLPFVARLGTTPVIGQAVWRLRLDSMVKSAHGDSFAPGFDVESAFADPDQVVADLEAMTYTSYSESRAAADDFIEEQSVATRLAAKGIPVLAIDGAEDQVLEVDAVLDGYKDVPGARIERMEGIGHSPNVEDPEATGKLILGFSGEGEVFVPPSPTEPRPNPKAKRKGGGSKAKPGAGN